MKFVFAIIVLVAACMVAESTAEETNRYEPVIKMMEAVGLLVPGVKPCTDHCKDLMSSSPPAPNQEILSCIKGCRAELNKLKESLG